MAVERARTVPLRTAVWMALGSAAFVGAFFAGVLVARARPEPGGGTAEPLSFAGTLKRGGQAMSGRQSLTFTLRKGEVTCSAGPVEVEVDGEGHFTAPIPLGAPGGCPAGFFDGSDVVLEVGVAGETFTGPVNPVPYAKYAEQVGTPDCPAGYERAPEPPNPANPESLLCRKGNDEVVRVGVGASAFWIDRYEASVWSDRDGIQGALADVPFGVDDDVPIPNSAQWTLPEQRLYAVSRAGVVPSGWLTWFQANSICRASGKRLPTGDEWIEAARATADPGANNGLTNAFCNTNSSGGRRNAGGGAVCVSYWGAQDMIGNMREWTSEWQADVGDAGVAEDVPRMPWPDPQGYGDSGTWNIASRGRNSIGAPMGSPVASVRGGYYHAGTNAGVFALELLVSPAGYDPSIGFRCVLSR